MGKTLRQKDKDLIWHPYTHLKTADDIIPIAKARGTYLYDERGRKIIDAISSWWVNTHGHGHPHIVRRIAQQAKQLDHVIFAGFTHEPAVSLAERLLKHLPCNQKKLFFSDNGSTAVEVALKMALQYFHNKGTIRTGILAFENAYHGDTFGAMAVSGRSVFTAPFDELTFEINRLPLPDADNIDALLKHTESLLQKGQMAAFIFEPLVLGAGGMLMYEAKFLDALMALCKKHQTFTVADEVMTGFYRTGTFFASSQLTFKPDIMCLSKGITGGTLPLGVTSCTQEIFDAFVDDDMAKSLFHGHSYTGNPIVCAAAGAALDLYEDGKCVEKVAAISESHLKFYHKIKNHKALKNVRVTGTIMAFELASTETTSYTNTLKKVIYAHFLAKGILLRPLGNVFYILPPYCISRKDLKYIYDCISNFLNKL